MCAIFASGIERNGRAREKNVCCPNKSGKTRLAFRGDGAPRQLAESVPRWRWNSNARGRASDVLRPVWTRTHSANASHDAKRGWCFNRPLLIGPTQAAPSRSDRSLAGRRHSTPSGGPMRYFSNGNCLTISRKNRPKSQHLREILGTQHHVIARAALSSTKTAREMLPSTSWLMKKPRNSVLLPTAQAQPPPQAIRGQFQQDKNASCRGTESPGSRLGQSSPGSPNPGTQFQSSIWSTRVFSTDGILWACALAF